jgi:hypothetical protein
VFDQRRILSLDSSTKNTRNQKQITMFLTINYATLSRVFFFMATALTAVAALPMLRHSDNLDADLDASATLGNRMLSSEMSDSDRVVLDWMITFVVIGAIVIASCACCKCCPWYDKLCCSSTGTNQPQPGCCGVVDSPASAEAGHMVAVKAYDVDV